MGELGNTTLRASVLRYSWLPQAKHSRHDYPTEIKPKSSRKRQFLALLVISLIWNGLTGVACYYFYENWKKGIGQGCLWGVLCIVCPLGLLLMIGTFRKVLILFNPTPVIRLSSLEAPPGGTIDVHWTMKGKAGVIGRLHLLLEGKEEAKYVEGTNTQYDRHVFTLLTVYESSHTPEIGQGHARIRIPKDAMHSFDSGNNKIQWGLRMRGSISNWPDLEEEYEIIVRPYGISEL